MLELAVRSLDDIAASIRGHWAATEEDRFAIGRDLLEARDRFAGDREFGQWLQEQSFPFNRHWALTLRLAAENEREVRAVVASQLASGKRPNIEKAVRAVLHPEPAIDYPDEPAPSGDYARVMAALKAVEALVDTDFADLFDALPPHRQARAKASAHRAEKILRLMCRRFDALVVNVVIPAEGETQDG